jgi:hypothetical protein
MISLRKRDEIAREMILQCGFISKNCNLTDKTLDLSINFSRNAQKQQIYRQNRG